MKLWQKRSVLDQQVESFTVADDYQLDLELLPFDCRASQAHVRMLTKIGILTSDECQQLIAALDEILKLHQKGSFAISQADEDCHTAIENYLVKKLGPIGEKIHTGRSRNDQVLTALRLYSKNQLLQCEQSLITVMQSIDVFIARYGATIMPGYTHTRKAMPTTVGMWMGALHDALADDRSLLQTAMKLIDQNPLGTGAGFGVSLPLDRQMTTEELGFERIQTNPIYAQNSRGKFEGFILTVLTNIMADLNRFTADLILFTMPGIEYFILPDSFLTGSSIMPHKKNPDVLEMLRAKYHELFSLELRTRQLSINLISGYHRDLQLTKGALMRGFSVLLESLQMTGQIIENLGVNVDRCQAAMTPELYSVEKVYQLVLQGVPFREAYRIVGEEFA